MIERMFTYNGKRKVIRLIKVLRREDADRRGMLYLFHTMAMSAITLKIRLGRVLNDEFEEDHPTLGEDADTECEGDYYEGIFYN
jgi:hypothetical protein